MYKFYARCWNLIPESSMNTIHSRVLILSRSADIFLEAGPQCGFSVFPHHSVSAMGFRNDIHQWRFHFYQWKGFFHPVTGKIETGRSGERIWFFLQKVVHGARQFKINLRKHFKKIWKVSRLSCRRQKIGTAAIHGTICQKPNGIVVRIHFKG